MLKYRFFLLGLVLLLIASGCSSIDKAESLYQEGDKQAALEMAISLMDEDEPAVRLRAVKLIGKIGEKSAGSTLLKHLNDPDGKVQREIIVTLGQLKYEPALDSLLDLAVTADETQIRALASSFRNYGKEGIDRLVTRFDSPTETSNRGAYKALMIQIGADVAPSIIGILKGRSFFENRENFEILVRVKNPRVARLMLPFLEDEEVATQVVEAIGRLGSGAVNATIDALNQMKGKALNIPMMENIIKILGELKDPRAVESLEPLSQHSSERIRDAVDRALFQIRGY
jgi:HEAT repeat protein